MRYSPALLEAVLGLLPSRGLSAIERFNLVNDCWALVLAGLMPLTDYLDLTTRFRGERDKNVWAVLTGSSTHSTASLTTPTGRGWRPWCATGWDRRSPRWAGSRARTSRT